MTFNRKKNASIVRCFLLVFATIYCVSCSRLSKEAKEIVGEYYINEISDDIPLMELRKDGTATYRNIKPEVLTITAESKWNVKKDSLIFDIDLKKVTFNGDSSLVGNIPNRISKKIITHDDMSLTLEQNGVNYVYRRRIKN